MVDRRQVDRLIDRNRVFFDRAFKAEAERNQTFLELLPTLKPGEITRLAKLRPALWARFLAFEKKVIP